jgi:hypothetical protein
MSLSRDQVNSIVQLVPVAVTLTSQLVDLVKRLQDDGYEVPSIDDLKGLNSKLKSLDDLVE